MTELRPCPFCGSKADIYHDRQEVAVCANVNCNNCGIPIDEWNTRPIEDALRAQLQETAHNLEIAESKLKVAMEALKDVLLLIEEHGDKRIMSHATRLLKDRNALAEIERISQG